MSEHTNKRIILPPSALTPRVVTDAGLALEASAPTLIQDALYIIQNEMTKFKQKSNKNSLQDSDHRIIQGYLKTLTEIERGIREREEGMDLSNKTDDELIKMVEAMKRSKKK
jgi:hypothetical protein